MYIILLEADEVARQGTMFKKEATLKRYLQTIEFITLWILLTILAVNLPLFAAVFFILGVGLMVGSERHVSY